MESNPHLIGQIIVGLALASAVPAGELQVDAPFDLDGRQATLTKLDSLPYVEDEYTARFTFDSATNPKLKRLRERYQLDEVVAPGTDEFDRQIHLMDWTHHQFDRFGQPSAEARGALEILEEVEGGHRFFCSQYAQVLVSAAASLGWVDRPLALRRHQGANKVGGSTEHAVTEIWSNQFRKWVMLDPTSNMFVEIDGVPLNAWEIRKEWFYNGGKRLDFVIGNERARYRKADLPIFLRSFEGFGDLTVEPDEIDKYGFIGYIPNTDLMDSGFDYGGMFIVKDALCDGTQWHTRKVPDDPAADPYFPIGQAAVSLRIDGGHLMVDLRTLTPNFARFEIRTDGDGWVHSTGTFRWALSPGTNRMEARAVNAFGVAGSASTAEVRAEQ
ncbi:hypothetical protein BH23VER1_BH23VER1_06450 [soil metagenome]